MPGCFVAMVVKLCQVFWRASWFKVLGTTIPKDEGAGEYSRSGTKYQEMKFNIGKAT